MSTNRGFSTVLVAVSVVVVSVIGGAITTYIIACVAGTFYNGVSMLGL